MQHALATLGLIGQIILYLVPGFTFFIILPSIIMSFYEGWPYEIAVYYCFITLTTVGFGDFVAGKFTLNKQHLHRLSVLETMGKCAGTCSSIMN